MSLRFQFKHSMLKLSLYTEADFVCLFKMVNIWRVWVSCPMAVHPAALSANLKKKKKKNI